MKVFQMKLQTKITILIISIVLISIYTTIFFTTRQMIKNINEEIETNTMNIARIVSYTPNIASYLKEDPTADSSIQVHIEKVLNEMQQVEMIVIADMKGVRYAHPNYKRIGEKFVGGDEIRVIEKGERYISEATGTLGKAIRAFAPIYDDEGKQVGFVMAGTLTQSINQIRKERIVTSILVSYIGLLLGITGAILVAKNIKKTLLDLEPEEISQLYIEKKSILSAIHEGIIAIDENHKITLINDTVLKLLGINEGCIIGKDVMEIFPTSRLPNVLESGISEYDKEQVIKDTIVITNRVPIRDKDKIVGALATFRDKTIITQLAEEVTGVRQIVDSLRANTHEFMNKLHVILGLIEVGELDEAKKYILTVRERQQQIVSLVVNKIKNPMVAALILGKFSRAKELGIEMNIDVNSYLAKRRGKINNHILVTIIGNLIENAMESTLTIDNKERYINLKVEETQESIIIEVEDNGAGIKEENIPLIFNRGFSTKKESRGVGLALIKEKVENLKGVIEVHSSKGKGTRFIIEIPKER